MILTSFHARRLDSVDVFRGLTVCLMIFVNHMDRNYGPSLFLHAPWHGCTFADVVFPFFIFIVGASITLAIHFKQEKGFSQYALLFNITKRALILFCFGLAINAFPNQFDLASLRIMGVLQRIALCYFIISIIYLYTSAYMQVILFWIFIVFYWMALTYFPVPQYGSGQLTPEGNFANYIDHMLISTQHLYFKGYDPEGIFSTLGALSTGILGCLMGQALIKSPKPSFDCFTRLLRYGLFLCIMGYVWQFSFPWNRSLWNSSLVLWTGGLSLSVYACLFWIIELKQFKGFQLFKIVGQHALNIFILHVLYLKLAASILITIESSSDFTVSSMRLGQYITSQMFPNTSPEHAALYYALSAVLFWFVMVNVYVKMKKSLLDRSLPKYKNKI